MELVVPADESALDRSLRETRSLVRRPRPAALAGAAGGALAGRGVYLRLDYWSRIRAGGSYAHTCYVARELARAGSELVCLMGYRFALLDAFGVDQVVFDPPSATSTEADVLAATPYYHRLLKPVLLALRPAFLYERLCLGNYAGALLSRELGIPYIVEYNGSEVSMKRSFDPAPYEHEQAYVRAEQAAFRQASMITVVSEVIEADLVRRGIDPAKILVNPNGADPYDYAPRAAPERALLRRRLGLPVDAPVVGHIGTFGGWHGIATLAAALPRIAALAPEVRFLLVGDGAYRRLVDEVVARHRLGARVRMSGLVSQSAGAELLAACDVFVCPHDTHMVDSRFFGSPTKLFEFMALAGGVVASDLEQIGQVLSPALSPDDLERDDVEVSDERGVLCRPGDADGLARAVAALARRPDVARRLGRNARRAVLRQYSWARHVERIGALVALREARSAWWRGPLPPRPRPRPAVEAAVGAGVRTGHRRGATGAG
jgi:glycosyltransferase involved in cell wall biosynthesis